jgi:hypothetical protein
MSTGGPGTDATISFHHLTFFRPFFSRHSWYSFDLTCYSWSLPLFSYRENIKQISTKWMTINEKSIQNALIFLVDFIPIEKKKVGIENHEYASQWYVNLSFVEFSQRNLLSIGMSIPRRFSFLGEWQFFIPRGLGNLKVSKSRKQFMVSSILPKNKRNSLSWALSLLSNDSEFRLFFWENWENHDLLLRLSDLKKLFPGFLGEISGRIFLA